MSLLLSLAVLLYSISSGLLAILAYVYGKTALSTKARYPLGLFLFSLLLLLQSAGTAYTYIFMGGYFGEEALPSMSIMGSLELVGVAALLRITL